MLRRLLADALIASGRSRAAARVLPGYAPALLGLGAACETAGDAVGAARAYEELLAAEPANPYANYNLGRLAQAHGDAAAAEPLLRAALAAKPDFADAHVLLAAGQQDRGLHAAAKESLRAALAADPAHPYANLHLGRLAQTDGDLAQAERLLRASLQARPDFAMAWMALGEILLHRNRHDEAEDALRRALELDPQLADAWHALGILLRVVCRVEESLEALARAQQLEPARLDLEAVALLSCAVSDATSADQLYARHRDYGRRLEAAIAPRADAFPNGRDPERRLRLGFVSSDFNRHPVAWFCLPLFEHLDRARCEVVCYASGGKLDEVSDQVREVADHWRDARGWDDERLAGAVREDGIDVLVDLMGHAGNSRLGVFARQPAPVQASWLGYLGTTGLTRIQYRLTDARADPPGTSQRHHTETLAYLPESLWCFRPSHAAGHAPAPPCARDGHVTFGSFNHVPKLSPTVRRLWADILRRLPQARLRLVGVPEGRTQERLARELAEAGVAGSRIDMLPRLSFEAYLREFDRVDIALDTTPYGGGTTTFDALWMGVPVLTLAGDRPSARSAASILGALGLEDWIAASGEDYVRLAVSHAGEPAALGSLRGELRQRLRRSPLMDEARFARDMQALLRRLWGDWCARPMP